MTKGKTSVPSGGPVLLLVVHRGKGHLHLNKGECLERAGRGPLCSHAFWSPGSSRHWAPLWTPRTNAITRSLLILLGDKSWEQIMDYRPLPCISAGVWAAEGMTKDEGMVHGCGRPAPKQGWSVWGSSKEHEWKRRGVFSHYTHFPWDVPLPLNAEEARSRKGEDLLRIMPIKHSGLHGRLLRLIGVGRSQLEDG